MPIRLAALPSPLGQVRRMPSNRTANPVRGAATWALRQHREPPGRGGAASPPFSSLKGFTVTSSKMVSGETDSETELESGNTGRRPGRAKGRVTAGLSPHLAQHCLAIQIPCIQLEHTCRCDINQPHQHHQIWSVQQVIIHIVPTTRDSKCQGIDSVPVTPGSAHRAEPGLSVQSVPWR